MYTRLPVTQEILRREPREIAAFVTLPHGRPSRPARRPQRGAWLGGRERAKANCCGRVRRRQRQARNTEHQSSDKAQIEWRQPIKSLIDSHGDQARIAGCCHSDEASPTVFTPFGKEYEEGKKALQQARAQQAQAELAIEAAKASKDVSGEVHENSILAGVTG